MGSDIGEAAQETLGKLIAYPVGLLLILIGLIIAMGNAIGGGLIIIAGVICLPKVRAILTKTSGITPGPRVVVAVVLVTAGAGAALSSGGGGGNGGDGANGDATPTPTLTPEPTQLIEKPPDELLPTLEDLGEDWTDGETTDNERTFINTEIDNTSAVFRVTVYDSIDAAKTDFADRRTQLQDDGIRTRDVKVGDEGFHYEPENDVNAVAFREQNVIGEVHYIGGIVVTAESTSKELAQVLRDTITK